MSRIDDLQKLLDLYHRRLQKLKEQEALYGLSVEPSILLEIEDTEIKIEKVEDELQALVDVDESPALLPTKAIPEIPSARLDDSFANLPSFIAGPPIPHPSKFFGRQRELKRLFNLWRQLPLQNAAIIGPKRSGKTSLLLYLKSITTTSPEQLRPGQRFDWLPEPERFRWIYVDFQDPRLGSCDVLLRYLLTNLNLPHPTPCSLDDFMGIVSQHLKTPTIVLLDEIGVALQRYPELDDTFWEGMRALATNLVGGNLAFVLAAHERPDQLAQHGNLGSPFFNIFGYTTTLKPLTEPEAQELIYSSPLSFPADDILWIIEKSGRWPLLMQILCRECLMALEDDEPEEMWREESLAQLSSFSYLLDIDH